jgi:Rrf2 family protein
MLARKYNLSFDLVSNLLKNLTKNGFISSVRGKQGGYKISSSPGEISLQELVRAIDGPVTLTDCGHSGDESCCRISSICGSKTKIQEITHQVNQILGGVNLQQIIDANSQTSLFKSGLERER